MKTFQISESRKDFLENWKSVNKDIVVPEFDMPAELKFHQRMAEQNRQGLFISNAVELRIEYANLQGISQHFNHDPHNYITDGFNYAWKQVPKAYHDFTIQGYRRLIFNAINSCKHEERSKIESFVDFQYKLDKNRPEYLRMLQHVKVLETDRNNNPIFFINFCSEITYLKKKDDATMAIKMPDGKVLFYKFNVNCNTVSDFGSMSEREISLLQLLSRGMSSRQIAEILFISPHTVDTHRRNLLEMTNCVDTTALIVYCRILRII